MKKVFVFALLGALVLGSCSKKESGDESNVMLSEPEVSVSDSASASQSAPSVSADSASVAVDSTAAN